MPWKERVTSRFCSSQGLVQSFATRAKVASCTEKCSVSRSKKKVTAIFIPKRCKAQRLLPCGRFHKRRQSCFGKDTWPDGIPVPQAWIEFDVDNVEQATGELESRGYRMLIKNKKEPWGQTVTRFISPEGLLVGVTFTPLMRENK